MRYRCPGCGYIYDEARGEAHQGFAPGTRWAQLPASWPCPDCVVNEKSDFEPLAEPAQPARSSGR
jgi:alkane 1-monooxygenase